MTTTPPDVLKLPRYVLLAIEYPSVLNGTRVLAGSGDASTTGLAAAVRAQRTKICPGIVGQGTGMIKACGLPKIFFTNLPVAHRLH